MSYDRHTHYPCPQTSLFIQLNHEISCCIATPSSLPSKHFRVFATTICFQLIFLSLHSSNQVKGMVRGKDRRVELGYSLALQYRRYYTHQSGTKLGGNFSQSDLFYLIAFFSGGRPTHQRTETADTTQTQQKNKYEKQCESEYSCCIPCIISTGIIVAAQVTGMLQVTSLDVSELLSVYMTTFTLPVELYPRFAHKTRVPKSSDTNSNVLQIGYKISPAPLGSVDPISKPYLNL